MAFPVGHRNGSYSPAAYENEAYPQVSDICASTIPISSSFMNKAILQKEKQILVDPVSVKESTGPKMVAIDRPPDLLPARPKFLSSSLPNSASSSPRFASNMLKNKKWRNQSQAHNLNLTLHLDRSKSCGTGRSSCALADELDLWVRNRSNIADANFCGRSEANYKDAGIGNSRGGDNGNGSSRDDDGFKCGALCLFLPSLGRGKPVKARKEEVVLETQNVISRTVSLEKFECGSWSSSAIINDMVAEEDGESANLYFDLPTELIRSGFNEASSPVSAAFVFEKDHRKGVLKSVRGGGKSQESSRHVRFSAASPVSSPSCITPRLRKAREDFNAFLEAQSA
ncbi:uncharacterized protein LOC131160123 [Malania oleifera]|uniref:uncharacterized protein LOC131160123 n=1 Tax=Malania oleifera TaxID=397392 RepID=UPI0025AE0583|nr:uncharacterized protein LOC131160123 [Malania oleifera]